MKVLSDFLLVKKDVYKSESNLILLDKQPKDKKFLMPPYSGEIIEVGVKVDDDRYKVGTKILYVEFGCIPFGDYFNDDNYYVLVPVSSVSGIVNDKNLRLG